MKYVLLICLLGLCACSSNGIDPISRTVNDSVKEKVSYKSDMASRGVKDFWQSPKETLKLRTGDCEDFAILQANILHEQYGIPADQIKYGYFKNSVEEHLVVIYNNNILDYDGVYMFNTVYKNRFFYIYSVPYYNTRTTQLYNNT